jgi:hypothetical protein
LSSAILFVAIVAIWACALVPRWLHRSQDATSGPHAPVSPEEAAAAAGADVSDCSGLGLQAPEDDELGVDRGTDPGWAEADPGWAEADPGWAEADPGWAEADPGWAEADPGWAEADPATQPGSGAQPGFAGPSGAGARAGGGRPRPPGPPHPPTSAVARARVLRARRRLLTILVALGAVTVGCALSGLTHWWTALLPVGMLVIYLLLLREAARADADARRRDDAHARERAAWAAHRRALYAQAQARATGSFQPAAEVIEISRPNAQVADQPYDQYADATVRAVGD